MRVVSCFLFFFFLFFLKEDIELYRVKKKIAIEILGFLFSHSYSSSEILFFFVFFPCFLLNLRRGITGAFIELLMANSEVLSALKALQAQFEGQTLSLHQTLQQYMTTVDSPSYTHAQACVDAFLSNFVTC